MLGNVAEWIGDCFHNSYEGAPTDGSAWRDGVDKPGGCELGAIVRGGGWFSFPWTLCAVHRTRGENLNTRYGAIPARWPLARMLKSRHAPPGRAHRCTSFG